MSGYHKNFILKNPNNSILKLKEEVDELIDAAASGNNIMLHQELSDVYLKLRQITYEHQLDIDDLEIMADTTERVFKSGIRESSSIYDMIVANTGYVIETNSKYSFNHFITSDINYRYVVLGDVDELNYILSDDIEYVEVIKGKFSHFGTHYHEGMIIRPDMKDDLHLKLYTNTIILVKTIGIPPNMDLFSKFNGKPELYDQFKVLKSVCST